MSSPDGLVQAAFAKGYADADARMGWMRDHPGLGVPCGVDPKPHPDDWYRRPRGLGYSDPPSVDPVYVAPLSLEPSVLPVPAPVDLSAGPALTGAVHGGWGSVPGVAAAGSGSSVVYAGAGDLAPPRRSLWARLTGKGR